MRRAGIGGSVALVFGLAAGCGLSLPALAADLPPVVESKPLPPGAASPAGGSAPAPVPAAPLKLEDRVARLERQMESQALVDLMSRIDALQQEVQDLRGQLEVETHKSEGLEQRQRELYLDIDRRLRQIETRQSAAPVADAGQAAASPPASAAAGAGTGNATAASTAGAAVGAAAITATAATKAAVPATGAASGEANAERDSYQKAFDLMKAGRYDEAIAGFRGFLARYPDGDYSANAQYWVGESDYVLRRFEEAATEFGKVVDFFPDSGKAPDALLKLGFSQYELQQWDKASQTLNRVVQQYPRSTARQLAEGRLQRMRMEGH